MTLLIANTMLGTLIEFGFPSGDWFERFGFPAALLLLILFALYRLGRFAINKVGDQIQEWFAEQTAFIKELRAALPMAARRLEEAEERFEVMEENVKQIHERLDRPVVCSAKPTPKTQGEPT